MVSKKNFEEEIGGVEPDDNENYNGLYFKVKGTNKGGYSVFVNGESCGYGVVTPNELCTIPIANKKTPSTPINKIGYGISSETNKTCEIYHIDFRGLGKLKLTDVAHLVPYSTNRANVEYESIIFGDLEISENAKCTSMIPPYVNIIACKAPIRDFILNHLSEIGLPSNWTTNWQIFA